MLKSHDALPTLEPQNQAKSLKSHDALPTLKPQNHDIFTSSNNSSRFLDSDSLSISENTQLIVAIFQFLVQI